jgi:3-deoxy-7-phosphoheptulonate synthase
MVIHLKKGIDDGLISELVRELSAVRVRFNGTQILVTPSAIKNVSATVEPYVDEVFICNTDIQLASTEYRPERRQVAVGDVVFGSQNQTVMMAGPCSVESEDQINAVAEYLVNTGVRIMRAGCFKPRTSPYSFQGLRYEGLDLLAKVRDRFGLYIITEVKDATHVDAVIEVADIVQVGAKAMYDHGILTACSNSQKPVLLKRSFGSTLQEFVQAAEFILSGGNEQVILCERGIRTFEHKTRFTLDLCGVAYLKQYTNLPIVVDPSHAIGFAYGVPDLARAAVAMGVDGLLIEAHPNPRLALSDASQQLDFQQFSALSRSLSPIAKAVGRQMI